MAVCPICKKEIPSFCVEPTEFDCPHCFQKLTPDYFAGYWSIRSLICLPVALAGGCVFTAVMVDGWLLRIFLFVPEAWIAIEGTFALWDFIVKQIYQPKHFAVAPASYLDVLKLNPK